MMSNKGSSEPAFPNPAASMEHYGMADGYTGISVRDYFAAKAMLGFLSGPMNRVQFEGDADVASLAYIMADAMLAERAK